MIDSPVIGTGKPSDSILEEFESSFARPISYVDIFESDGATLYAGQAAVSSGSLTVDSSRPDRRNIEITFDANSQDRLGYGPGQFWYDKIIRPYKGIYLADGTAWVMPLGEFTADSITRPRFPSLMTVSCRDKMARLERAPFSDVTTFGAGANVASTIQAIAASGGIALFAFQSSSATLPAAVTFDAGSSRVQAIVELATSIGMEAFFDAFGFMVLRPFVDPVTAPTAHEFRTGVYGNLSDYSRATTSAFLRNDIVVRGGSQQNALVFGRATNTNASSPTSTSKIGNRIEVINNQFVSNNASAVSIASAILGVSGLEQYNLDIQALAAPWLEAGEAIDSLLPDAEPGEPIRFLLTNITLPLGLGVMSSVARRVSIVG